MSLAPLLAAPLAIQVHAFAAIGAFVLGVWQMVAPKGGIRHRRLGVVWAMLMLVVAISSFFIHDIRLVGPFGPIHLLSLLVLVQVPRAVLAARRLDIAHHEAIMTRTFLFALVLAGAFTFLPGRIMHAVAFGG